MNFSRFGWLFVALCAFGMGLDAVDANQQEPLKFRVTRQDYTYSSVFDLASDSQFVGSVVKWGFHLATQYDLYNGLGEFEGQGNCRLLSLGHFYAWATEIDVYDADGNYVGMIDGQAATTEPAKFSFYDAQYNRVGVAYLDQNCTAFSIYDPNNSVRVCSRLTRNFIQDTVDNWDVVIYDSTAISPMMVKIFAAFACDSQDQFKEDN